MSDFGVIGLGVMGQNLALNIEEHGFSVAVWNLETEWTQRFVQQNAGKKFTGAKSLDEFVKGLRTPRRILMMIKAGEPVDSMIAQLSPLLQAGDILIDGGNSWFKDTQRREKEMRANRLRFFGMGVSGGEEGARHGPSLMPGGELEAYRELEPVLTAIAARSDSGPCVTHVGPDGAGHFVKMVHNGIEYGDMQLIAEAYDLLHRALGFNADELARIFDDWNRTSLKSYLIEITSQIFAVKDPRTGKPLVDVVLDKAGQKGTGKWTAEMALDLIVPAGTIAAAIEARVLSSMKDQRVAAARVLAGPQARFDGDRQQAVAAIRDALYASKVCSYAQGMNLIQAGSEAYNWKINLREMARIWKAGCIIRAEFLNEIMQAYERDPRLANLLLDAEFRTRIQQAQQNWRWTLRLAIEHGIPVPSMTASLGYYDSYRTARLPQNLTQAQRDYFGAHTYQRADRPEEGFVHSDWQRLAVPAAD
ncbi:MAG: NADP-dependent phosphogluconate dehydrogenase [Candidatus Korobacteraceae bacterium]